MRNAETYVAVCFAISGRYGKFYFGILGKRGLHTNRHFIAVRLCPFDRGFVEEIDVDAVVSYRIDEFGQFGDRQPHITARNRFGRGVGIHLVHDRDFIILCCLIGDQAGGDEGFVVGGFEFEAHRKPGTPHGEPPVPDNRIEFYLIYGIRTS